MKLVRQKNFQFQGEIFVGNPPQSITACFDTGSANAWIMGKKLHDKLQRTSLAEQEARDTIEHDDAQDALAQIGLEDASEAAGGHFYDPGLSISAHNLDRKANIDFVGASMSGLFYTDDIRVGSKGQIVVSDVTFGAVTESSFFSGKAGDLEAVIGMGYPALAEDGTISLTDEMMHQKALDHTLFAFYLSTSMHGANRTPELTFGYYDKQKMKGDLDWHPVIKQYMFMVKLDDIKINGQSLGICHDRADGCVITFDSGSPYDIIPPWADNALAELGYPSSSVAKECSGPEEFGELIFVINGKEYGYAPGEWNTNDETLMAQSSTKKHSPFNVFGPKLPGHAPS